MRGKSKQQINELHVNGVFTAVRAKTPEQKSEKQKNISKNTTGIPIFLFLFFRGHIKYMCAAIIHSNIHMIHHATISADPNRFTHLAQSIILGISLKFKRIPLLTLRITRFQSAQRCSSVS